MPKRALVVGASSGVGRALALELCTRGVEVIAAARRIEFLRELEVESKAGPGPRSIQAAKVDIADPSFLAGEWLDSLEKEGEIGAVFLTAAQISDEDTVEGSEALGSDLTAVNYTGLLRILAAMAPRMQKRQRGTLVLFSSIAAAVPRGTNMVYASNKAGLEAYGAALRHALHSSGVGVRVYALGYVRTAMTEGKKLLFPVATPEAVASYVVSDFLRDRGLLYWPRFWTGIVFLLRRLPWFVFRKLRF